MGMEWVHKANCPSRICIDARQTQRKNWTVRRVFGAYSLSTNFRS